MKSVFSGSGSCYKISRLVTSWWETSLCVYSDGHLVSLQRLSELLKSKKPEDLQEANRLIKNMVKEVRLRPHELSEKIITCKSVFVTARLFPPGRAQNTEGEKAEKHAGGGRQQRQAP